MDNQALELEEDMLNYNKVKDIVVRKLVSEGYLSEEDGEEFTERCQVLVYKGTWFSKWFDKNMKSSSNKNHYFIKIIEMHEKQTFINVNE